MPTPENEPTLESHLAYQGRIINLRVDKVKLPNGAIGTREIVEHSDCVCVVPVNEHNEVILVRQYRKPVEENLLEVPAGGVEKGEASEEAALRELKEETGFTPDTLQHLSTFWTTPGFCTERMHAYLATGLRLGSPRRDEDEHIRVVNVPMNRIPDMIRSGEIRDGKTIATLLLVLHPLHLDEGTEA